MLVANTDDHRVVMGLRGRRIALTRIVDGKTVQAVRHLQETAGALAPRQGFGRIIKIQARVWWERGVKTLHIIDGIQRELSRSTQQNIVLDLLSNRAVRRTERTSKHQHHERSRGKP